MLRSRFQLACGRQASEATLLFDPSMSALFSILASLEFKVVCIMATSLCQTDGIFVQYILQQSRAVPDRTASVERIVFFLVHEE